MLLLVIIVLVYDRICYASITFPENFSCLFVCLFSMPYLYGWFLYKYMISVD